MIEKGLAEDALGMTSHRRPAEPKRVIRNAALALDLGRCIPVQEVSMNRGAKIWAFETQVTGDDHDWGIDHSPAFFFAKRVFAKCKIA